MSEHDKYNDLDGKTQTQFVLTKGTIVSHYRIIEKIGAGGMGEVYLADDTTLGRKVAIKFLPQRQTANAEFRVRLEREARAAACLNHPNITTVHDIGDIQGQPYIVMEYVDGPSFTEKMSGAKFKVEEGIKIFSDICDALRVAHQAGIVHRDLKPSNIVLNNEEKPKLIDFGLAHIREGGKITREGAVMGTVSYMSPEQVRGEEVDHRTDIWSLGVMLYQIVSGQLPFRGGNDHAILYAILNNPPAAMVEDESGFPEELQGLISKCLTKRKSDRYDYVNQLTDDLEMILQQDDKLAGLSVMQPSRELNQSVAILDFTNISGDSADDWLGSGLSQTITADLKKVSGIQVAAPGRIKQLITSDTGGQISKEELIQLGYKLNVRWVISGGYQRLGEQIRIIAHAIDVSQGEAIDSVKIDGSITDIFSLQDKVVKGLAQSMNCNSPSTLDKHTSVSPDRKKNAFEYFARGRQLFSEFSLSGTEQAQGYFEKAIALDSNYALAYSGLGSLLLTRFIHSTDHEDLQVGIKHLKRAIQLDSKLADPYLWLTYAYMRDKKTKKALEAGKIAIRLDPNHPVAHYFLGVAYGFSNDKSFDSQAQLRALSCYKRCVELEPRYQPARMLVGLLYISHGQYDYALPHLEQAVEIELSGRPAYIKFTGSQALLGGLHLRLGNLDQAEQYLFQSLKELSELDHAYKNTFVSLTYCYLGRVSLDRSRYGEAVERFESALSLISDHPNALGVGFFYIRARIGMALACHGLGIRREAVIHLDSALNAFTKREKMSFQNVFDGGDRQALFDFATYYSSTGKVSEAMSHLHKAIKLGWREVPALTRYHEMESLQDDNALRDELSLINKEGPLP